VSRSSSAESRRRYSEFQYNHIHIPILSIAGVLEARRRTASVHRRSSHTPGSLAFGTHVYSRLYVYGGTCSAVCLSRRRASSQLKTELSASRSSLRGRIMDSLTDAVICDTHSPRCGNLKRRRVHYGLTPTYYGATTVLRKCRL